MDEMTFVKGLSYLKMNYLNWGFDIQNPTMVKVWYKKFEKLENKTFIQLLERYTAEKKYPPNSPADLLDFLKEAIEGQEMNSSEAWEYVRGLIREHGFNYGRDKIYAALEDKPALLETVKIYESELINLTSADTNTPLRFKNTYAEILKQKVAKKQNLLIGSSEPLRIAIDESKTKLIGGKNKDEL